MAAKFADLLEQTDNSTRIRNFLTTTNRTPNENQSAGFLATRLSLLETYWSTFTSTHRSMTRFKECANRPYHEETVFDKTEEAYVKAQTQLRTSYDVIVAASNVQPPSQQTASTSATDAVMRQIQLPKINLPEFHGDPLEWESFRDLFKPLVHNVQGLSQVQKFFYLQSCLKGEAEDLLKGIQITDTAYAGAWEDLEARYGNTRILSFMYMKTLFAVKGIKRATPNEIKRLLDSIKKTIRAFSALKKPIAAWDEFFVYILSQKLDKYTKLAWESTLKDSKQVPSFQELSDYLENRVHALEAADSIDPLLNPRSDPTPAGKPPQSGNFRSKPNSYSTTTKAKPRGNQGQSKKCLLCSDPHFMSYCSTFKAFSAHKKREEISNVCELVLIVYGLSTQLKTALQLHAVLYVRTIITRFCMIAFSHTPLQRARKIRARLQLLLLALVRGFRMQRVLTRQFSLSRYLWIRLR